MYLTLFKMKTRTFTSLSVAILASVGLIAAGMASGKSALMKTERLNRSTTESVDMDGDANIRKGSAPTATNDESNYVTLLEEDFSLMTNGSEEEFDETQYPLNYPQRQDLPDEFFHNPGWEGAGVHEAGGHIGLNYYYEYLATEDDVEMGGADYVGQVISIKDGGYLATPYMNLTGHIRVSFKARAFDYAVNFTCYIGNDNAEFVTVYPKDGWVEKTFEWEVASDEETQFAINAMFYNRGKLAIDDLKIESEQDYVIQVQKPRAIDFTYDGFTINWNSQPFATNYLVSLEGEKSLGEGPMQFNESFEGTPDSHFYWEGGEISNSEESKDGSKVLNLTSGDYIIFDGMKNTISAFEYSLLLKEGQQPSGFIYYEYYDGATWKSLGISTNVGSLMPGEWSVINSEDIDASLAWLGISIADKYKKIRCTFSCSDLAVDCLSIKFNYPVEIQPVCEDVATDNNYFIAEGLDHAQYEYYYTIKAVNKNGIESVPTARIHAKGIPAPRVLEATDVETRGAFTANWEAAPKAENYNLHIFGVNRVAENTHDYKLFEENFTNAKCTAPGAEFVGLGNGTTPESLDDYCDNQGWTGTGTIIGDGKIGCEGGNSMWGMVYELYSPEIDLDNNSGIYKVTVKGVAKNDDFITIQGDESDFDVIPALADVPFEKTVTLSEGRRGSRIMIYALNNSAFAITHFSVTQDLQQGDLVYSTIRYENYENETSARVRNLDLDRFPTYAYSLRSGYVLKGEEIVSNESERENVEILTTRVEGIDAEGNKIAYERDGDNLILTLQKEEQISVYSINGILVAQKRGSVGRNVIPLAAKGLYVVKVGENVRKFIIE